MQSLRFLCLIWTVALLAGVQADDFTCVKPTPAPNAPSLPTVLQDSDSYQTRVEENILEENQTTVLDEYLDYMGNRAMLKIYEGGNKKTVIFSFATDEVFEVQDKTCIVTSVEGSPYRGLFSSRSENITGSDARHVFGTAAALKFAANKLDVYQGMDKVRGVPADVWTTCTAWPATQGKVRVSYYFSRPGWSVPAPTAVEGVPMRIEVEGVYDDGKHFHHLYDFINFLPYLDTDASIFLTPPNVICPNRKGSKTNPPPTFKKYFKYRAELIDPTGTSINHFAVWYDEDVKMVREDTRTLQRLGVSDKIIGHTISEIHDFNTGVRYIKDTATGGCQVKPIDPDSTDSALDVQRLQYNGTLIIDQKKPSSFFKINDKYRFTGQRQVRGVMCDIFASIVPDYEIGGTKFNATFEYAILAADWNSVPLDASELSDSRYPLQLTISVPQVYFTRIYNFFDFREEHASMDEFDISECFDNKQKLSFQLTFPGTFSPGTEMVWTAEVWAHLAETMQISPIRISGITVTTDTDNIYVNAYILGAAREAEFEKKDVFLEHTGDKTFKGITMPGQCADLCIENKDFICDGFQYCPDDGYACRLSKDHLVVGEILKNATVCDNFSRAVRFVTMKEPLIGDAYTSLQMAVEGQNFQLIVPNNDGFEPPPYVAIYVELKTGQPLKTKPLPSFPSSFFYRLETVEPNINTVLETYVWYDQDMQLVRYDTRNPDLDEPFVITRIHDFTKGVQYVINQVYEECSVSAIPSKGLFDVRIGPISSVKNGSLTVAMLSPSGLLFLDDTYTYVGESTVRGILCDVYESRRSDFDLRYYNMTKQHTVFKYYFQAGNWDYVSTQGTGTVSNQPVQLSIEDKSTRTFMIYNFYDFTEQHYAPSFYDTTICYNADERKDFVIAFRNQPFHPVLDGISNTFLNTAILKLAEITYTSPIRFQGAQVTYDDTNVYLVGTMLGNVGNLALFSAVMKVDQDSVKDQTYAESADDCATACLSVSSYICNSFDYCEDDSKPNCVPGTTHGETQGDNIDQKGGCLHYSRTENGSYPAMSIQQMYEQITDKIYNNQFVIPVPLKNGTEIGYLATDIRDDVLMPTDPENSEGGLLRKFVVTPGFKLPDGAISVFHNSISVTECARMCIMENTFDCEAFDYIFTIGTCRISSIHPDLENATNTGVIANENFNVYSRLYTAEYTKYNAEVFSFGADAKVSNIKSAELCAKECTAYSDFRCESFEMCSDGTCRLYKTHILDDQSKTSTTKDTSCVPYSRNHLFDYVERKHQYIDGHDDGQAQVEDREECAQLCASGHGLPSCASFEVCQVQIGEISCTFSTADPTVNRTLVIKTDRPCTLYTLANPSSSDKPSQTTDPNTTSKPAQTANPKTSGKPSQTAKPNTDSNPAQTEKPNIDSNPTQTENPNTHSSPAQTETNTSGQKSCAQKSPDSSSDTGPRVGIAFGTLTLGILVGGVSVFLFMRCQRGKVNREDATMLRTWNG